MTLSRGSVENWGVGRGPLHYVATNSNCAKLSQRRDEGGGAFKFQPFTSTRKGEG